jgi:hypothetical protein
MEPEAAEAAERRGESDADRRNYSERCVETESLGDAATRRPPTTADAALLGPRIAETTCASTQATYDPRSEDRHVMFDKQDTVIATQQDWQSDEPAAVQGIESVWLAGSPSGCYGAMMPATQMGPKKRRGKRHRPKGASGSSTSRPVSSSMDKGTTRFQGGSDEPGRCAAEIIDQNRDGKVDGYFQHRRPELGQLERAASQRGGNVEVGETRTVAQKHFDTSARADSERSHRQGHEHTKRRAKRQAEDGTNELGYTAKRPTVDETSVLCLQLETYCKHLAAARRTSDAEIEKNLERWREELEELTFASIGLRRYREVEHKLEVAQVCFEAIAKRDEEQAERDGDAQQSARWLDGLD